MAPSANLQTDVGIRSERATYPLAQLQATRVKGETFENKKEVD